MPIRRTAAAGLIAAAACAVPLLLTPTPAQDPGGLGSEVNRRLASWEASPALSPFATAPAPAPGPVLQPFPQPNPGTVPARTKICLSFGVNRTDPAWYGSDNPLEGPENDARALADLARGLGFDTRGGPFLTQRATSQTLFAELKNAASRLEANDVLVITYSGHGSTVKDLNGDELPNTEDQTWCLYDRMVIDDELGEAWPQFKRGVKIYVVADSCHSGTSVRNLNRSGNPISRQTSLGMRALAAPGVGGARVRALSLENQKKAADIQLPAFGNKWTAIRGHGRSEADTQASVLLLAACGDRELASESGGHGLFTTALVRLADGGRFQGTYRDLMNRATSMINDPSQHPRLFQVGAQTINIETDRPFGH